MSPSLFHVAYSSTPTGWHHVVGAVCGCGGCGAVSFDPALWTWGSTVHWSSLTLPLHRHRMATVHPLPACCESLPLFLPSLPFTLSTCLTPPSLCSFVCSRSGHILEIDHQRMAVQHVRRLLPAQSPDVPLTEKQNFSMGRWAPIPRGSDITLRC